VREKEFEKGTVLLTPPILLHQAAVALVNVKCAEEINLQGGHGIPIVVAP
jgi:hypothetical protein